MAGDRLTTLIGSPDGAELAAPEELDARSEALRGAGARQIQRGVRGNVYTPPPVAEVDVGADGVLPSDRQEIADGDVGLAERFRLDAINSHYRGSLAGGAKLAGLARIVSGEEDHRLDNGAKENFRREYEGIVADLARYDIMRPWGTTMEATVALGGTLAGGMASPESVIGLPARGASLLWRTAKAGLTQGVIQGATDPIIQYLNRDSGVAEHPEGWDPTQTAMAFGMGVVVGGGLHVTFEGAGKLHTTLYDAYQVRKLRADLAKEDPAFSGETERTFRPDESEELPSDIAEQKKAAEVKNMTPEELDGYFVELKQQVADGLITEQEALAKLSKAAKAQTKVSSEPNAAADTNSAAVLNRLKEALGQGPYETLANTLPPGNKLKSTDKQVEEALAKIKEAMGLREPEPVRTKGAEPSPADIAQSINKTAGGGETTVTINGKTATAGEKPPAEWTKVGEQKGAEPTEAPKGDVALENAEKFQAAVKNINDNWPTNGIQQKVQLFPDELKLLQDAGFNIADDGMMSAATRIKLTNEAERIRKGIPKTSAPAAPEAKPPAEWTKVGEQKGSNPGGVYKDAAGEHWYVKTPKSEEHIANERLANELYRMAGAVVPETKTIALDGKSAIASRMLNDAFVPLKDAADAKWAEKVLRNNFAADAWLANHDVIGLNRDNVMVSPAGEVVRIDQGGAMKFRAQGEPKEFDTFPKEWESMRDPKIAKEAGPVFKGMTKKEKIDSLNRVLLIPDADITAAAVKHGAGNFDDVAELANTLIQRKKFLHDIRDDLLAKGKKKKTSTKPSDPGETTLTFQKGATAPADTVGNVAFSSWQPPADWTKVPIGKFKEPALPANEKVSTGAVIVEPDGRVWLMKPANEYGGYKHTFPKGQLDAGLSPRANAIKEVFEETGLKVKLTGFIGDYKGDTGTTRFYRAEREGGHPLDHGPEAEAVLLATTKDLPNLLNKPRDQKLAADVFGTKFPSGSNPFHMSANNVVNMPATKPAYDFPPASVDKAHALGFHLPGDTGSETAKKLGRVWFHGTIASKQFEAFDLKYAGKGAAGAPDEPAVFLSATPDVAKHGGTLMAPMVTNAQKVLIVPGPQPYNNKVFRTKIKEGHAKGYDAVLFEKVSDFGEGAHDQLAVLDPKKLRYIHAAFDPKQKQSAKLAAIFGKKTGEEPIAPPEPEWFGESKVVDKKGEPLVVYHGTDKKIEAFDPKHRNPNKDTADAELGFFFTDRRKTAEYYSKGNWEDAKTAGTMAETDRATFEGYARKAEDAGDTEGAAKWRQKAADRIGPNVVEAHLSLQNPLIADYKGKVYNEEAFEKLIKQAKAEGRDGVIIKNTFDADETSRLQALARGRLKSETVYVAFDPEQIRPAEKRTAGETSNFKADYENMLSEARNDMVDAQARGVAVNEPSTIASKFAKARQMLYDPEVKKAAQLEAQRQIAENLAKEKSDIGSALKQEGVSEADVQQQLRDTFQQQIDLNSPEKILAAATLYKGKVYTGAIHSDAVNKIGLDDAAFEKEARNMIQGFATSHGRFIGRGEATVRTGFTGEATTAVGESLDQSPLQAMAQRKGGQKLAGEQERPATGIATPQQASPQQEAAIKSLQQQAFDFADAIDFPLRQGRVGIKGALGTFNRESGVVRVKEAPDFEVVTHEAGHAIEQKVGQDITNLHQQFAHELGPLDYDYPNQARTEEGFAEYVRRWIGNPAHAQQIAPGFTSSFQNLLEQKAPDVLAALVKATESYQAYLKAPSVDVIDAVRRSKAEDPKGWGAVRQAIREDGLPATIGTMMQNVYRKILDEKSPAAIYVRTVAKSIRDADPNHALVNLKDADNPYVLLRLAGRAQQAAMRDMLDGTYGYHSTTPSGPSLTDALAKATGGPSKFGKWDPEMQGLFSDYLIARRAEVLWRKFEAGDLANPPTAFSKGDAEMALAEFEKQHPTFREASDMVHAFSRAQLKKALDGGQIDVDLHDRLSKEEFYVPFMRDLSDKPLASGGAGGSSPEGPGMTSVVKKMKGSARDIIDPIESMMMQSFLLNRTIQHNDVIRAFVALSERPGADAGRFVEKLPAHEAKKYSFDLGQVLERKAIEKGVPPDEAKVLAASVGDLFGEDPLMGSFFKMEPAGKRGEPILFYKEGGKLKAARFSTEKEGLPLYEALTAMPQKLTDVFSELVSTTSAITRTGITSSPTFALSNYIRDQLATALLRKDYVPFWSGAKGIKAEFAQDEAAKLYAIGGGVAAGASVAMVERAVEADINALAKKGYLVNRLTSFKGLLDLASFTEAGTRNSIFKTVFDAKKAQGLSDYEAMIEAAYQATDILDFSSHGSRTLQVRNWVPFLNAHLKGLDKAYRTMVQPLIDKARGNQVLASDPEAFNNALLSWVKVGGVGMVLGAGWAAINHENEAYRDATPWLKSTHFVVPMGDRLYVIPKPFELGLGFTAGEYAFHAWKDDDPRAAMDFAKGAWQVVEPPTPFGGVPLFSTVYGLAAGKDIFFTGNDIVPDRLQRLPSGQQYTDRTSSLAKAIGSTVNISPMKVDFAIGTMFGNWGRDIMTLSSAVDPKAPAQRWEDAVFARRFIKDPTRSSDVTTKFWKFMSQTTGAYNQDVNGYENLLRQRDDAGAQKFLGRLPAREQAFVVLKSGVDEDGKGYKPDEKRLHPLQRAYDAVTALNALSREVGDNTITRWENKDHLPLSRQQRSDVLDNIRELKQMEMRNAFVIMKEPGYANRALLDTAPTLEKIRHVAPAVAEEIATRYATAKIRKTTDIAKIYPDMEKALLQFGSEADISSLAFDVDGFEFDGDKARRPPKRRIPIMGREAGATP